jgi:hypothetical protein
MVSEMTLRRMFQVHHGPRQWIYLPYALILSGVFPLGAIDDYTPADLWPYLLLISIFVIQLVLPTFAGWAAAFIGWVGLWLTALVIAILFDHFGAPSLLLIVGLASASSAPLYIFRPRLSDPAATTIKAE